MWAYILRRLLYNIPVYLSILLLMMLMLRVNDPSYAYLGKSASPASIVQTREDMGLARAVRVPAPEITVIERFAAAGDTVVEGQPIFAYDLLGERFEFVAPVGGRLVYQSEAFQAEPSQQTRLGAVAAGVLTRPDDASSLQPLNLPAFEVTVIEFLRAEDRRAPKGQAVVRVEMRGKAFEVTAPSSGKLRYIAKPNDVVRIGSVVAQIDIPFVVQYLRFVRNVFTLDFSERSWDVKIPVGEMLGKAVMPSLFVTVPTLVLTAMISICVALVSAYFRGRRVDRTLMFFAVIGMSISYLVYIIMGQYFGSYWLPQKFGINLFAIQGYSQELSSAKYWFSSPHSALMDWRMYCALPVLIGVTVGIGYDTRFYRAVMVEESTRDYITTARAKGAGKARIMFVHMLKNAMIPIITRLMISLPFLIEGAVLVEYFFGIPGMGRTLIDAIRAKDFPVIQAFTAILAAVFIVSNILTDVLYALVDPRVRLS
ncbi:MAG: ABC transporter permease subunit [Phycisphaeraceae bacterium]|nr:ABC transporter permease subunit [Phycisphaeraceae bacterium]